MEFSKLHNLGNNFIFINDNYKTLIDVKKLCDSKMGVGADGIILYNKQDDKVDITIYNADGSEAKMCGNALLCIGKLFNEDIIVNTISGEKKIKLNGELVDVEMGRPSIVNGFPRMFHQIRFLLVNTGNLHLVALVEDVSKINLEHFAKSLQNLIKANINIVSDVNNESFKIRTYELGVGETSACGSGIASSFFTLRYLRRVSKKVVAKTLLGEMEVYEDDLGMIHLKSTPRYICKGEILDE